MVMNTVLLSRQHHSNGQWYPGIILCTCPTNERWRYIATSHCNVISHWLGAYIQWSLDISQHTITVAPEWSLTMIAFTWMHDPDLINAWPYYNNGWLEAYEIWAKNHVALLQSDHYKMLRGMTLIQNGYTHNLQPSIFALQSSRKTFLANSPVGLVTDQAH